MLYFFNFSGPFVSAIGKTWHPEHFCCDSCKVSLQNQQFVEEENKLYCQKCFANFAPSCSSCGETIIGVSFSNDLEFTLLRV